MVVQKHKLNSRHHHPVEMNEERNRAVQFRSEGKRRSAGLGTYGRMDQCRYAEVSWHDDNNLKVFSKNLWKATETRSEACFVICLPFTNVSIFNASDKSWKLRSRYVVTCSKRPDLNSAN